MPKLTVVLGGLLAYVPIKYKGKSGMRVLAVSARAPQEAIGEESPRAPIMSPHFPVLRFKAKYEHPKNPRKPDWYIRHQSWGEDECLFLLRNEHLTIDTNTEPDRFYIKEKEIYEDLPGPDIDASDEDYEDQRTDFKWVPRITLAAPLCGSVDRPCGEAKHGISVAVDLFEGELSTHKLAEEPEPPGSVREYHLFKFEATNTCQAIAEEAALNTSCSDFIEVSSERLDNHPDPIPDLWLDGSKGNVVLRIEHLELQGLLDAPFETRGETAEDFLLFYELAERRPARDVRRVPKLESIGGGGAGQRICPPTRFAELDLDLTE